MKICILVGIFIILMVNSCKKKEPIDDPDWRIVHIVYALNATEGALSFTAKGINTVTGFFKVIVSEEEVEEEPFEGFTSGGGQCDGWDEEGE